MTVNPETGREWTSGEIAAQLRLRIISGRYAEGQELPSLGDIETEFGVSNGTARVVVAELRGAGFVLPRSGLNGIVAPSRTVPAPRLVAEELGIEQADPVRLTKTEHLVVFTRITS